jgi:hypothetical protein
MKKQWLAVMLVLGLVLNFSTSVMAHSGGGGDGGTGAEMNTPQSTGSSESKIPPPIYSSLPLFPGQDTDFIMGDGPDTTSVDRTEITILSEEDIGQATAEIIAQLSQDPNVQWVVITAAGIFIGYATAGAGLPVYAQAVAGGTFSAAVNYASSEGEANQASSTAYSGVKDVVIGFIPIPPPAQAAVSWFVDKVKEILPEFPSHRKSSNSSGGYGRTFSN